MEREIDIRKIGLRLLKFIWVIILAFAIGAAAGYAYVARFKTDTYTATTSLIINNNTPLNGKVTQAEISASESLVKTCITILRSDDIIREQIIEPTGVPYSPGQIKAMTQMSQEAETYVFDIRVTAPTPEHAEAIARAYAQFGAQAATEKIGGGTITELTRAKLPTHPNSKGTARTAATAGLLLALISAAIIVVTMLFDTRIKSEEDLDEIRGDVPIIGMIPSFSVATGMSAYSTYGGYGSSSAAREESK